MAFQDLVRWLVPREDRCYGFLEAQAIAAHEGALALRRFNEGSSANAVRYAVQELEHRGDELSHEMEEALAKAFVTPIDRGDLQRLSSELDDVLDLANGAIRAAALFGVSTPTEPMGKLMDILVRSTLILKEAMPNLRKNGYSELSDAAHALRKLEKEGDQIFREAVRGLFHDEATDAKKLLREKQVLEDLENAVNGCEAVGETLAQLAVKNG
jgi:predicted phosphate transport protein (TIGR00153 family)